MADGERHADEKSLKKVVDGLEVCMYAYLCQPEKGTNNRR